MWRALAGVLILATTAAVMADVEPAEITNPRFFSPNGGMCLVVRIWPDLGDFESVPYDSYQQLDPIDEWLEQYPLPGSEAEKVAKEFEKGFEERIAERVEPEPYGGALYRIWPGGRGELLSEFVFERHEPRETLVADDGHFVTHNGIWCGEKSVLATIHRPDGSVVRTLLVRDLVTKNDQQWLCRGPESDVHFSLHEDPWKLQVAMMLTDGNGNAADARHKTFQIDLATGAVPPPDRDLCPAPLVVIAEPDDRTLLRSAELAIGSEAAFDEPDVVTVASWTLLEHAIERVIPEYPDIAGKARISGRIRVDVVVGRDGKVEAARIQPLPFGIYEAAKAALLNWKFEPYPTAAQATRFSGSFIFHFQIVRDMRR